MKLKPNMLDLYSDYLICQNHQATATGLAELSAGNLSHDKVTRFLHEAGLGSKELWQQVKPQVRQVQAPDGVLITDDTIEEKPYTGENDIVAWHHSHAKGRHVKGINVLSCLVRYDDVSLPVAYDIVHKDVAFCELKTRKTRRKSSISKNELFRQQLAQCQRNALVYKYVLADNWFGAKENLAYIHHELHKYFIFGIKSNRTVALSLADKQRGRFQQASTVLLEPEQTRTVYLQGLDFPVQLIKKVFTNENGSTGVLYLVTNDLTLEAGRLYQIYQKRWRIEEYHKSIKNNASLARSPTKVVRSQSNHIFASLVAYVKLESLKIKTALNHFALKYKLLLKSNQAALLELQRLQQNMT